MNLIVNRNLRVCLHSCRSRYKYAEVRTSINSFAVVNLLTELLRLRKNLSNHVNCKYLSLCRITIGFVHSLSVEQSSKEREVCISYEENVFSKMI